eukprot:5691938-Alexandrium_andersonii.AAC.1
MACRDSGSPQHASRDGPMPCIATLACARGPDDVGPILFSHTDVVVPAFELHGGRAKVPAVF